MAKVRKPYNRMRQLTRFAEHHIKDVLVAYTNHLKGCVIIDKKRHCIIKPTDLIVGCMSRPWQWSCYVAVFGRIPLTGEEYMKSAQITVPAKYYQVDLAPIFEEHHGRLIESMPDTHLCGVGWIADPNGGELSEDEAAAIFTQLEAWS